MSIYSDQVRELVAIGAAIAANCEPCFKYHFAEARRLGVGDDDMLAAVRTAQKVKQAPANAMLKLAGRLLGTSLLSDVSSENEQSPP
jgi:AhpD family alkylhydroperoxidase